MGLLTVQQKQAVSGVHIQAMRLRGRVHTASTAAEQFFKVLCAKFLGAARGDKSKDPFGKGQSKWKSDELSGYANRTVQNQAPAVADPSTAHLAYAAVSR